MYIKESSVTRFLGSGIFRQSSSPQRMISKFATLTYTGDAIDPGVISDNNIDCPHLKFSIYENNHSISINCFPTVFRL